MFNKLLLFTIFFICPGLLWATSTGKKQFHHPEQFLKQVEHSPEAGKKIYQQFCAVCHAKNPRIALGAPRIGNEHDWHLRMQQGIPEMLERIDAGLNAMPPRGGCFECSDAQLAAAIAYMLPKNQ